MCGETTKKIKDYATDSEQSNSLLALLDYYDKTSLMEISEVMGLEFLEKLEKGEIKI